MRGTARDPLECPGQRWPGGLELVPVEGRELAECPLALIREPDIDLATVAFPALAPDETPVLQAIDQLARAMMLDLEPLRQLADRQLPIRRQSAQRQQQPVLLRLVADGALPPRCAARTP